ncbi:TraM recognition domain-containing protein [Arthrobacter sp. ov118]|uniref:TraM recognition domain-containing protein n=1 Tax=Arthrobacter sp. ov118 TaxID=1761747 RepID=UPI003529731D
MEDRAERSGGRLPKPALFALDELANVVRWAALPDQFSHYGSKGLIVMGSCSPGHRASNCGAKRTCGKSGRPPTSRSTAAASPKKDSSGHSRA